MTGDSAGSMARVLLATVVGGLPVFLGSIAGPVGFGTIASVASFRLARLAAGGWLLLAALGVHLTGRLLVHEVSHQP